MDQVALVKASVDDDVVHAQLLGALQAQGIAVLLALLTGLVGLWAVGLIFCVLAILLLVINLRQSIES